MSVDFPDVKLTYGTGYMTDCYGTTEADVAWTSDPSPTLTGIVLTVIGEDIFDIKGTASASGKKTYYEYNLATDISADIFTKILVRYKTSVASVGIGAKVEIVYDDASTEVVVGSDPLFSTSWVTLAATLANGATKNIDKVRLYALSDAACTNEHVYYDFLLVHEGTFTFPKVDLVEIQLPIQQSFTHLFQRQGPLIQQVGTADPVKILLSGQIKTDNDDDWRGGSASKALLEHLIRVWHEAPNDIWQWLSIGDETNSYRAINCKVFALTPIIRLRPGILREWELPLAMFSMSTGDLSDWSDLGWFGI